MMTENKQNQVPEIRFNGFTNAWEQRKFDSVFDPIPNNTLSRADLNYKEGKIKSIHYGDILIKYGAITDCGKDVIPFITGAKASDYQSQLLQNGDVLIADAAEDETVGKATEIAGITGIPVVSGLHTIACRPRVKMQPNYLGYYMNSPSFHRQLLPLMQGIKVLSISRTNLAKTTICYPTSAQEQSQIGKVFAILDDIITLHKRKLDGLVTLKDGFLQQMFPAGDEVMPRVRFAEFTGNWEERRLGEMLTERNEQFKESEGYPLMSFVGNVGVVPKGEQYDRSFLVKGDDKKYKRTELNDFIYSSNNLETGSIGCNRTGKAVISPVYSIFYSNNDSESLFVGLLSKQRDFINKMIHYRQGVMYGQWRIHERDFLKIIVLTPTISEQNRIIDFFKNFDEQIAAQTAKLEQLRQLKAAYLQRMFI